MPEGPPACWPIEDLTAAYRRGEISPLEVTRDALGRIRAHNPELHAYTTITTEQALAQAGDAEARYRAGDPVGPLAGVPVSIKDLFDVEGVVTTYGSLVYSSRVVPRDDGVVSALRKAGAVFVGKTNTAEFGQSATTENLLGPPAANPWATDRTPGGSSGGAAASVAAGFDTIALGSDGGGSIRIPAAMCGLFGIKPSVGLVSAETAFHAMGDFGSAGPLARRVADARPFLAVLTGKDFSVGDVPSLRVGWCPAPDGRPVDPGVAAVVRSAVDRVAALGHDVDEINLPIDGWPNIFGPLVLWDEWLYRGHLLDHERSRLTRYARRSIEAASELRREDIEALKEDLEAFRARVASLFDRYDVVLTPATATTAFINGSRPSEIDGKPVDSLWGPFPFTAPFNVAGTPAASLPCGLSEGLPVGLQVVAAKGKDALVVDFCAQLEEELAFPYREVIARWDSKDTAAAQQEVAVDGVAVLEISNREKRNALTLEILDELATELKEAEAAGATAVVLRGAGGIFSSGMDLAEVGHGVDDLQVDEKLELLTQTIRRLKIPVIAALEGPCIGAGLDLALACDERVAGAGVTLSLPATHLGIIYRPAAVAAMVQELGKLTVTRLLVLGERFSAEEALAAGLVGKVVPSGLAFREAVAIGRASRAPVAAATTLTKKLIAAASEGAADLDEWERPRRELVALPERRHAVAQARRGEPVKEKK